MRGTFKVFVTVYSIAIGTLDGIARTGANARKLPVDTRQVLFRERGAGIIHFNTAVARFSVDDLAMPRAHDNARLPSSDRHQLSIKFAFKREWC
jgi:hypothetical protein